MSNELAAAFRRTEDLANEKIDRRGWTPEQWAADAERIMGHIDGAASALLNGHISGLLHTIRTLRATTEREAFIAKAIADPEGQRLATAAANLATTWGKEWAVSVRSRPNDVGEASTDPADRDEMLTQIAEWNTRHDAGAYLVARVVGPWKEDRP